MKTIQTGDQNLIKQINKSVVFKLIEEKGPVSRAHISKSTGLNKATVSTMVAELINDSFVYEITSDQSSGGRKPVMLYFNNHAGYTIGIDLGVNYILGVLTDLKGNIIGEINRDLHDIEFDYVIENLTSVIELLLKKAPESTYGVVGISIGVPGNVDKEDTILFAPNLKWKQVDLKQVMEDRFHIPTTIENEANAGSHGERLYGAGKNVPNLIYVSIGVGIGTGIIINHNLYTGASGISGEMGHFTIEANGKKCSCGSRGCWELYASESALFIDAKTHDLLNDENEIDLGYLISEAQMGNTDVLQMLNKLGENIGIGLTNIINIFNPEIIVIGNRIAQFENWIANPIDHVLEERLSTYHNENTEIRFSKLGKRSSAIGAATFSTSKFLSDKRLYIG
ncbi:putative NBD/HSP70 family sugar kinase [Virgibacillus natechei]|uniref:NBD/HSP70 family sugar kinase n=1 Tax=Virgibacillus natechei TaxID=1216297 RepID=A0ABS4IG69_9BACI|nr:ROK family protein [Virgibacillus natechei]MBP1969321.1 putative NBD/HSP70 family sugar kinase [Virgibacillus natechei]UZD12474.1 ROK family protein [Virgibacillus natechei]